MLPEIIRITEENYPLFSDMLYLRAHGQSRTPDPTPPDADVIRELADPNLLVYAVQADGAFVGWISLVYMPKVSRFGGHGHIYVDELWVAPEYRRRGYARALLVKADDAARARNAVGVRLYVNIENPGAQRLYEQHGFEPAGTAYFMEKPHR